jgi:hypothetical protein
MSFETTTNPKSFTTILSPSKDKRDVLWNAIEPGDPYDIRRYNHPHVDRQSLGCQARRNDLWGKTWR